MSDSKSKNSSVIMETTVGFFVIAVFLGLAVFTIVVSGSSLFNKKEFPINVVMPDAMGLRRNDAVIARGTTVGTVDDVHFEQDGVHVRAMLNAPVRFFEGYKITVVSTSILGGRQLVIEEGDETRPQIADVTNLVGEKPADLMDDATAAIHSLREFLQGEFLHNLDKAGDNLATISARLEHGEGTLGKLLSSDDTMYQDLKASIENIRIISDRLEKGEGSLGKLLSSDDSVYQDLKKTMANLSSISDRLEQGEGTLGKLLSSDDAMYNDLKDTMANLKSISDRLERGEGSLGKLLSSDTELYDNVNGAVSDVREVIDDIREATPLSTFSSFIFGAF